MFQCCQDIRIKWKDANYVILGDDIVIGDDELAKAYLTRMYRLGVEISYEKSHTSTHTYEFAKR
jgi:hypothetical protein